QPETDGEQPARSALRQPRREEPREEHDAVGDQRAACERRHAQRAFVHAVHRRSPLLCWFAASSARRRMRCALFGLNPNWSARVISRLAVVSSCRIAAMTARFTYGTA